MRFKDIEQVNNLVDNLKECESKIKHLSHKDSEGSLQYLQSHRDGSGYLNMHVYNLDLGDKIILAIIKLLEDKRFEIRERLIELGVNL
jgi:hypothetical protein